MCTQVGHLSRSRRSLLGPFRIMDRPTPHKDGEHRDATKAGSHPNHSPTTDRWYDRGWSGCGSRRRRRAPRQYKRRVQHSTDDFELHLDGVLVNQSVRDQQPVRQLLQYKTTLDGSLQIDTEGIGPIEPRGSQREAIGIPGVHFGRRATDVIGRGVASRTGGDRLDSDNGPSRDRNDARRHHIVRW